MTAHKIYASSNGDRWFLVQSPDGQPLEVEHRANAASGGTITRLPLASFLHAGNQGPEHQALRDLLQDRSAWPKGSEAERLDAWLDELRMTEDRLLACESSFADSETGAVERGPLVTLEGASVRLSGLSQIEAVLGAMRRALEIEKARAAALRGGSQRRTGQDLGDYDSVEP
jgi:hypothetical protein